MHREPSASPPHPTYTKLFLTVISWHTVDRSPIKLNSECLGSLFQMKQIKVISRRIAQWRNPESALIPADVAESQSVLAQHSLGWICHYVKLPRPASCYQESRGRDLGISEFWRAGKEGKGVFTKCLSSPLTSQLAPVFTPALWLSFVFRTTPPTSSFLPDTHSLVSHHFQSKFKYKATASLCLPFPPWSLNIEMGLWIQIGVQEMFCSL